MRFLTLSCAVVLIPLMVILIGCGNDSPDKPPEQHIWRWPATPDTDNVQYGEMIAIPGGTFTMGWNPSDPIPTCGTAAQPTSAVTVSSFWLDKYEVTNLAYKAYADANNNTLPRLLMANEGLRMAYIESWYADLPRKNNYPLEGVSWWAAIYYANWRSRLEGYDQVYTISGSPDNPTDVVWDTTKNGYRLPTEAEWEYASRSSSNRWFSWGNETYFDTTQQISRCCFYTINGQGPVYNRALADAIFFGHVGRFPTSGFGAFSSGVNAFGNFDMTGSAAEWVWDWYGPYTSSAKTNPRGPATGTLKIVRGGSMVFRDTYIATYREFLSYNRRTFGPTDTLHTNYGFRLARNR